MTVTQYKGPRMVPLVPEPGQREWDKNKAYEYWTLVQYQGASYISVQNVPVGIEITNENYWMLSADYNSQVEQYRREVASFDGRITANADAVVAEKNRAVAAEKVNADAIAVIRNKTMIVIGDSYGNWEKTGTPYWHEYVKTALGFNKAIIMSSPGTGLFASRAPSFRTQAQNVIADSSFDHDSVTNIYIQGGCNDYSEWKPNPSVYGTEAREIANLLRASFPNAEIMFVVTGWPFEREAPSLWPNAATNANHSQEYYQNVYSGLKGVAKVINIANCLGINPGAYTQLYSLNDSHPSSDGSRLIANNIINYPKTEPTYQESVASDAMKYMFKFSDLDNDKIKVEEEYHFDTIVNGKYYSQGVVTMTLLEGYTSAGGIVPLNWDVALPVKFFAYDNNDNNIILQISNYESTTLMQNKLFINGDKLAPVNTTHNLSWSVVFDLTGI